MYSREKLDPSLSPQTPLQKMYTAVRSSVAKSAESSPTEYTVDPFLLFYDFNQQQLEEYQEKCIELLNEIFVKSNLTEIPNDFMKQYRRGIQSTLGSRGSFSAIFKKNEEAKEQRMTFPCSLIETVQTASVEIPNTYEFYRVPIIIFELTNYYTEECIKINSDQESWYI